MDEGFGDLAKLLDFRDKDKRELDEDDARERLLEAAVAAKAAVAACASLTPREDAQL